MNPRIRPINYRNVLFALVVLSCQTATISAEALIEQGPIPIGNPASSSVGISSVAPVDGATEFTSRAYDNFVITEDTSVTGVSWMGAFNQLFNPNEDFRGEVDFRIEVLADQDNRPDPNMVLSAHELDGGTAGRDDGADLTEAIVPDQAHKTGGAIVSYEADLSPFVLEPGNYWLSIQARQTFPSPFPPQFPDDPNKHFDPSWSWVLSTDGDQRMYQFDEFFGDIVEPGAPINSFDAAFTLLGESLMGIPGDFDKNGFLEPMDIDMLTAAIRGGSTESQFDVNEDGDLSEADLDFWVGTLKGTVPGDTDLNFEVAFRDFLNLAQSFAEVGGWGQGNFDLDETVEFKDFLVLAQNFGHQAQPSPASVPEPSAGVVMILGIVLLSQLRDGRKQSR